MGALAKQEHNQWLPQDDILLKTSIEDGASLESLARGAVEFSRKFTIKELEDRWRSLLYNPVVSLEACARMAEFEQSAAPSKSKKVDISKESKVGDGKRKCKSVRSWYYAMRKRVCNGPLYQSDLSFPMDNSFINEARDHMVEDPLAVDFELEDCNFDGLCNASDSVFENEFFIGQQNMIEDPMDQNTIIDGQIRPKIENPNMIGEACSSEELYGHNFFEENDIETKATCNGKDMRFSDCGTTYGRLGYSSSLPETTNWKTVPNMPGYVGFTGNNVHTVGRFDITGDNDVEGIPEDADIHLQSVLNDDMPLNDFQTLTGCTDDYLADLLTNEDAVHLNDDMKDGIDDTRDDGLETLIVTNEDEVHLNDEENDVIDDTGDDGYATLLSNIIPHASDDEMCNIPETSQQAPVVAADSGTILVKGDVAGTHTIESNFQSCSGNQTSTSAPNFYPRFPEYCNGVIHCILNTEDPEIPCNDPNIFPSKKSAHGHKRTQNKAAVASSSGKDNTCTQGLEVKKSHSTKNLDVGLNCAANGHGVEIDTQDYGGLCQKRMTIKKEHSDLSGFGVEKIGQIAESNHVQINVGVMNLEEQQMQSLPNLAAPILEEADEELLSSENEVQFSDCDADIPYFSDVESMILDSDLCPADQDNLYATTVAKYQQDDAMKEIIRLEQNARSYMHRDMASHGAFAVLFGRHSKHYIKKPEVLLGRATDGVKVDIDLAREGKANNISRRQASIRMDKDGTFKLKNLGKWSIYVNSDEISSGKCLNLDSNCLIEIRGKPFIFAVNQRRVKQYLDDVV